VTLPYSCAKGIESATQTGCNAFWKEAHGCSHKAKSPDTKKSNEHQTSEEFKVIRSIERDDYCSLLLSLSVKNSKSSQALHKKTNVVEVLAGMKCHS